MPKGAPSSADTALAHVLAARGILLDRNPVTAMQIQRWRTAGALPAARVTHRGERGRTSTNPPSALDAAISVIESLHHTRSLNAAVLIAFGSGREPAPPLTALRRAYSQLSQRYDRDLNRHEAAIDDQGQLTRLTRDITALMNHWLQPAVYSTWSNNALAEARDLRLDYPRDEDTKRTVKEGRIASAVTGLRDGASAADIFASLGLDTIFQSLFGVSADVYEDAMDFTSPLAQDVLLERFDAHSEQTLANARRIYRDGMQVVAAFAGPFLAEQPLCRICTDFFIALMTPLAKPVTEIPRYTTEDIATAVNSIREQQRGRGA